MSNIKLDKRKMLVGVVIATIVGILLRWMGISFEGVDYRMSLYPWYQGLAENGTLKGLAEYNGDYNIPYVTLLYYLTKIPLEPLVSIKLSSIFFDMMESFLVFVIVRDIVGEEKNQYGFLAYTLMFCNPVAIVNSGYLAQCESVWVALALLSFWCLWKNHPVWGMLAFGAAFAMKPQGIFILPIIILLYYKQRNFSLVHFVWFPIAIQALCIPAILGGCTFDIFIKNLKMMMGHYPYVYYYYPNIWTYIQNAPYYVFGKVGIFSAFAVLLVFMLLFAQSKKSGKLEDYFEYIIFTTMTCVMILPCMHERYNYMAELLLPVCAIWRKKYRIPALVLVICSMLCNGQSYMGWPWVSHELLAACNIVVYIYMAAECVKGLGYKVLPGKEETLC